MEACHLAYHGTRSKFKRFNLRRCNPYCCLGRGFYFTSDKESAESHAGYHHGDTQARRYMVEDMADSSPLTKRQLMARYVGFNPTLITAYVTIKRPFVIELDEVHINRSKGQYYYGDYNQIEAIYKWGEENKENIFNIKVFKESMLGLLDGMTGFELWKVFHKTAVTKNFEDFLKILHCDGVIMNNPQNYWGGLYYSEQKHYVVFRTKQIHIVSKERVYT